MEQEKDALRKLRHDVRAQCANLMEGLSMLELCEPSERPELLKLMHQSARGLADSIGEAKDIASAAALV